MLVNAEENSITNLFKFIQLFNKSQELITPFSLCYFLVVTVRPPPHSTVVLFSYYCSSRPLHGSGFSFPLPVFQLSLTAALEHAAGKWWMITCHSLFIIFQTVNYISLMLVVPLEIYMLGTDRCENGISFAKCLSVGTARWLQPGCFNSCVCLTMSSLTACHRSHCSKALFIARFGLRLSEHKDAATAACAGQAGSLSDHHLPLFPLVGVLAPSPPSFLLWMSALC